MEDIVSIWNKLKNANIGFIPLLIIYFIPKFSETIRLFSFFSRFYIKKLTTAKVLLQQAGYHNAKEMTALNSMIKYHTINIVTKLANEEQCDLYCYLLSKSTMKERIYKLHKTIPYIKIKDNVFYFRERELKMKKVKEMTACLLFMLLFFFNSHISSIKLLNLAWFFNTGIILTLASFLFYFHLKIPNSMEVKDAKQLLKKADVNEFRAYQQTSIDTINLLKNS